MSAVQDFDRLIDAVSKISALGRLRDKVAEALATDSRVCGNCNHWMKHSECPRETRNNHGRRVGPSMGAPACAQFSLEQWVAELKAKRIAEAVSYAKARDLPVPPLLERAIAKAEGQP